MRRWKIAAVAATAAAALLAAGCSSSGSSSAGGTSNAPVTLTIWHNYGTEQNATALVNLAKEFHKLHPNITVDVVSQPASSYFALLQAKAISRNGPDLAVMWTGLFTLQYKGFLQNLKGLVPASALGRVDPDALKWTSDSFNAANGPYVIPRVGGDPVAVSYCQVHLIDAVRSGLTCPWYPMPGDVALVG